MVVDYQGYMCTGSGPYRQLIVAERCTMLEEIRAKTEAAKIRKQDQAEKTATKIVIAAKKRIGEAILREADDGQTACEAKIGRFWHSRMSLWLAAKMLFDTYTAMGFKCRVEERRTIPVSRYSWDRVDINDPRPPNNKLRIIVGWWNE